MLKSPVIIADGWVIQIALKQSFLEFVTRQVKEWNQEDQGHECTRQIQGFLVALEGIIQRGEV